MGPWDVTHALCNIHVIRELTFIVDRYSQDWAQKMIDLLYRCNKARSEAIARGDAMFSEDTVKAFFDEYDRIIEEGLALNPIQKKDPHKKGRTPHGKPRNLLDRMKEHKEEFLLFVSRFEVPFTNNQAERDLRATKAHTKISGSFRSLNAAREYLTIMAFISTAKKHQYTAYEALRMALDGTPEKNLEKKA